MSKTSETRFRNALQEIADFHCPSQPESDRGDELSWVLRHVGKLRAIAKNALDQEPDRFDEAMAAIEACIGRVA